MTSESPFSVNAFEPPEYSDWECELFGSGPHGISFRPPKDQEPNWFWRLMQYLCFGNKWKKVKDNA